LRAAGFLAAALFTVDFFAVFLTAGFLAATRFAAGLRADVFLTVGRLAGALRTAFFVAFFAPGFFAEAFFFRAFRDLAEVSDFALRRISAACARL
jgi:hypothetical protein